MAKRPTRSNARGKLQARGRHTASARVVERWALPARTQPARSPARIFVVDDEPAVRRGLSLLVNLEPDLEMCGEAAESREALKQILTLEPDLVLVDLRLKKGSGLKLISNIHRRRPGLKIVVFSMQDAALFVERTLQSGAHGYVTKEEGAGQAIRAIRAVLRGGTYVSQRVAEKLRG